jgi:hypothetical protein
MMLHGDYHGILGKSLLNTFSGGLEHMYTSHALHTVRPAAQRNDDHCILYGIVFDHDTIKELRLRIASLLRSTTCARSQQVYGISRKAGAAGHVQRYTRHNVDLKPLNAVDVCC